MAERTVSEVVVDRIRLPTLFVDVAAQFTQLVSAPERIPMVIDRAFRTALTTRSAVVVVPHDAQEALAPDIRPQHGVVITSATRSRPSLFELLETASDRSWRATGIVGVARRPPAVDAAPYAGVDWRIIDIGPSDARDRLTETMRDADVVVHLGWILQPDHDQRELYRTNVTGTRNVLAAAVAAGVPHLVYNSSVAAHSEGPKSGRVDESWPTAGIHTSHYSRHKAIVERLLDRFEPDNPSRTVTRMRPGLIFQGGAGRVLAHLFLGPFVPVSLLRLRLPLLPLPGRLIGQAVHADDVAMAMWLAIEKQAGGAFNIAAEPVLDPAVLADALGIRRTIRFPLGVLRTLALMSWRLRLQRSAPGWLDIAVYTPLMSTQRARDELGWAPRASSIDALREMVAAIADREGRRASPPLWPNRKDGDD